MGSLLKRKRLFLISSIVAIVLLRFLFFEFVFKERLANYGVLDGERYAQTFYVPKPKFDTVFKDSERNQLTHMTKTSFKSFTANRGEDSDPNVRQKRNYVKQMMKHAWDAYKRFAWGENELRPVSKQRNSESVFGSARLGVTIIDSLDTLLIMGMTEEFETAKAWIENSFNLNNSGNQTLPLFEINIRLLGGLLSAYALTNDDLFIYHAMLLAERLVPAFNTFDGMPYSQINLITGKVIGRHPVLAEWGTLSLEFNYLAHATGVEEFHDIIRKLYNILKNAQNKDGLFPVHIVPNSEKVTKRRRIKWIDMGYYTFGAGADSFYEYLLKNWLLSGKTDEESYRLYLNAITGAEKNLIKHSSTNNFTYLAEIVYGSLSNKMGHLACFSAGMLALGGKELGNDRHIKLGEELARTCRKSYENSPIKLGPEIFVFDVGNEAGVLNRSSSQYYILRPEVVESYFFLWRVTHKPQYRNWGWDVVQALERYCRIESGGYSGIKNVYSTTIEYDDVQQSFFLAETLKYLYLLFSDDSLIPLDEWVFNTEAHPFPIIRKKPFVTN